MVFKYNFYLILDSVTANVNNVLSHELDMDLVDDSDLHELDDEMRNLSNTLILTEQDCVDWKVRYDHLLTPHRFLLKV